MRTMVLLVGDQPIPNLLPVRHIEPERVILASSSRTRQVAERLRGLLEPTTACLHCEVDAYDITTITAQLQQFLADNCRGDELLFNLTGGTKPMSLAALQVAREGNSPFAYFQSEYNVSRLYCYRFAEDQVIGESVQDVSATVTLDEYLRLHIGDYRSEENSDPFERAVCDVLREVPQIDEVKTCIRPRNVGGIEIDLCFRRGTQVAFAEIKSGKDNPKKGIDQIQSITEQRLLGTYAKKFLVLAHPLREGDSNRRLVTAYQIRLIELPSWGQSQLISDTDQQKLVTEVLNGLGAAP